MEKLKLLFKNNSSYYWTIYAVISSSPYVCKIGTDWAGYMLLSHQFGNLPVTDHYSSTPLLYLHTYFRVATIRTKK